MKRYESYRSINSSWIDKMPSHWNYSRGDSVLELVRDTISPEQIAAKDIIVHYSIPAVQETGGGMIEPGNSISSGKFEIHGGEILFSKLNPRKQTVCIASKHKYFTICSTEFLVLKPRSGVNKFFFYLLLAHNYSERTCSYVKSATKSHQRANPNDIYKEWYALPSIQEQTQIARYLDYKTAKIDALIEKKQRLIELLEEERTAIINQAVTKGLNPDVPMKDSGIEWLGEIPEGWEVKKLKFVTSQITNGYVGPTRDLYYPTGIRYIQSLHLKKGGIDFERSPYYVSKEWSDNHPRSILKEGDVLVVQTGAVGEVAMVTSDLAGSNCHALIILRSNDQIIPKYLLRLLESSFGKAQMKLIETGALHPHINSTKIKDIEICVPSLSDQESIISMIDDASEKILQTISKVSTEIELLKEYKTTLISEVVTGKVDVRDEVIPE